MRDLGILFTGKVSVAHGINDAGQVVLVSDYGGDERSFITGPNGAGLTNLGSLSGGNTRATAINNAGQVVGWSQVESSAHAFITGPNGEGMTYLGGGYSQAWDVNEAGRVAGAVGDLPARAFITGPNGEGMTVLGTLGGHDSWGWAINAAGQVAGESSGHPFITGPGGLGMRNLGAIGGDPGTGGSSRDINDAGQVVGTFWPKFESGPHAFITGPDGKNIVDLNSLVDIPDGVVLTEAVGINNMGQVVAFAQVIPEPKIYAMFLAGLGLIGYIARRRKYLGRADHWNFA
jgi:probable HAF family extracellular repeat protein